MMDTTLQKHLVTMDLKPQTIPKTCQWSSMLRPKLSNTGQAIGHDMMMAN